MTTKIFEELPSRDNRPASSAPGPTDMKAKMEKRVRQAVYDIRYRARREGIDVKQAYAQYMQNSSLNGQERNLVKAKIFGRSMAEDYNIEEFASNSVAKALFKVFVEGVEEESILGEEYLEELKNLPDRKYKVRVTDKNGTSYVRYATRDKISDLRANPNIESVEMTEYGEPYEGERKGGKQTAAAKAGKKLDPVGKEDADVNNNGIDNDPSDKYIMKRRKAIGSAIASRKEGSVKENFNFIQEKKNSKKEKKYDVMRGKNTGRIKLFPEVGKSYNEGFLPEDAVSIAQQQFMALVHQYKQGKLPDASPEVKKAAEKMSDTEAKKFASTKHEGLPQHVQREETACDSSELQRDTRGDYAKKEVIKNRLRSALGVKNPIVITSDEADVKEGAGLSVGISKLVGNVLSNPRTSPEQGAKNFQKNLADPVGTAIKSVVRSALQPANMTPEAQKARSDKYRPEEVQIEGELIDERRRADKGTPRKPRDRAMEVVRSMPDFKQGLMTRSGKTVAQHQENRGVKKDRTSEVVPEPPTNPPAKKLATKKEKAAAANAAATAASRDMYKPRAGESD